MADRGAGLGLALVPWTLGTAPVIPLLPGAVAVLFLLVFAFHVPV